METSSKQNRAAEFVRLGPSRILLNFILTDCRLHIACTAADIEFTAGRGRQELGIRVADSRVLWRIVTGPDPAAGELFMAGSWEMTEGDLGAFTTMMARNYQRLLSGPLSLLWSLTLRQALGGHSWDLKASRHYVRQHYDIGDDLYELMLDEGMIYSCAFFDSPQMSLREAQINKLRTAIRRLGIGPGMHVLDIGCGWGEACRVIAAETGAAIVHGITLAENQLKTAIERSSQDPHPPEYYLADYREHAVRHPQAYERILSIGMFEHVGGENYRTFFAAVRDQLARGGKALIHTIMNAANPAGGTINSIWLQRYIFPGGRIPDLAEMLNAAAQEGLVPDCPPYLQPPSDYAETLRRWRTNFRKNLARLDNRRYDARFRRMWLFYLAMCEAMFDGCGFQVGQVVFRKRQDGQGQ
jgi:cyclopropane-fatty-acyl-phospholipid synthase